MDTVLISVCPWYSELCEGGTVDVASGRGYRPRLADQRLDELLAELPAVMVAGPRAAGKTTTARRLAAEVMRLDDPAVATAVAADPDAALRRASAPLLIDEWQEYPPILAAIKRAVDMDARPGRFLLTGSVEAGLTRSMWPGTGRVVPLTLHTMTMREISSSIDHPGLLTRLRDGAIDELTGSSAALYPEPMDVDGYVAAALTSGFPEPALNLSATAALDWLDAYVEHVVHRDVRVAGQSRDPVRLRRYLEVLGLSTAGTPTDATVTQASGLNVRTVSAYDDLLASLYIVDSLPAWTTNRLSRLVRRPKRYVVDAGLAASAARIDAATILRDGGLLGRLIDTFVVSQLRPEADLLRPRARLHHLRSEAGRQEVDVLVDLGGGRIAGIEVKAGSNPTTRDARHLVWLRQQLGDAFVGGVVLHTGPLPFPLGDRLWALPISALWRG